VTTPDVLIFDLFGTLVFFDDSRVPTMEIAGRRIPMTIHGLPQILGELLLLAKRSPLGARERVAIAECVEHLAAHAPRCVRAEGRTEIAAVTARGLHEAEHAPGDEVLAIGAAAARVKRARRHGTREAEVRDDAFVDVRA